MWESKDIIRPGLIDKAAATTLPSRNIFLQINEYAIPTAAVTTKPMNAGVLIEREDSRIPDTHIPTAPRNSHRSKRVRTFQRSTLFNSSIRASHASLNKKATLAIRHKFTDKIIVGMTSDFSKC